MEEMAGSTVNQLYADSNRLPTPRIEIDLHKIEKNARVIVDNMESYGLSIMGVTKAVIGNPQVAKAMQRGGIKIIADSRLENIHRMKAQGVVSRFVLLRSPTLKQAPKAVSTVDISLNTDIDILRALSAAAIEQNKIHSVILMIEMGDLREGILPDELPTFLDVATKLQGIKIIGCGTNLACMNGVGPNQKIMDAFSELVGSVMRRFELKFEIISGGSSANLRWLSGEHKVGAVNNLRFGEAILLGREPLERRAIDGLSTEAFRLWVEVIESRVKKVVVSEETFQNSFGERAAPLCTGTLRRTILNIGYQDIVVAGLKPASNCSILGASSDHLVIDSAGMNLHVGDEVAFNMNYNCLLAAMMSPFVSKIFMPTR